MEKVNSYEHTKIETTASTMEDLRRKNLNGMRFNLDKYIISCSWENNSYLSNNEQNSSKRTVK